MSAWQVSLRDRLLALQPTAQENQHTNMGCSEHRPGLAGWHGPHPSAGPNCPLFKRVGGQHLEVFVRSEVWVSQVLGSEMFGRHASLTGLASSPCKQAQPHAAVRPEDAKLYGGLITKSCIAWVFMSHSLKVQLCPPSPISRSTSNLGLARAASSAATA